MTLPTLARRLLHGIAPVAADDPIAVRQLAELRQQIPSLYALLTVNALALAATHYAFAPAWMTLGVPGALCAVCVVRALAWWRLDVARFTAPQAVRRMRATSALTVPLAVGFVTWAIMIDAYGGPLEKGHVAIFVAITVIACIFCLTHLPLAALLTTGIVGAAFLAHCLAHGDGVFVAIALNVIIVAVVMVRILANNFLTFLDLVESQGALRERHAEMQRLMDENARLAHTDSLTGLPNRRYLLQRLDAAIEASAAGGAGFAFGIFDLDRFKPINDTHGHTVGDRVLETAGARLRDFAGPAVTLARLGGDEFGVLIQAPGSTESAVAFCDRVCEALQAPVRVGELQIVTGCSGGLALYPDAGRTAGALFDRADHALYHSKDQRRGLTTLFSQVHEDAIRAEQVVETALRSADLTAEMDLHFQPILDTATNTLASVEALARWTSPTLGRVPPDRFIAAAERCGMMHALTILLLRKALGHAARLPPAVGLSFNLSSHDLTSPETVVAILAAVHESGLDPRRLTLELTETALIRDFARAQDTIRTLRATGMQVALDDFGTGYSSLGYVHRLPLDKIKIDRGFMADIESDLGRSIVRTVLDLCQNLGLDCIAEGIETPAQLDAVRGFGCRYVQGYLIGTPMPMEHLVERFPAWAPALAPPERRRA